MCTMQVYGRLVFPGAAMIEAARAAGTTLGKHSLLPDAALQNAAIPAPLMLQNPKASAAGHLYLLRQVPGSLSHVLRV